MHDRRENDSTPHAPCKSLRKQHKQPQKEKKMSYHSTYPFYPPSHHKKKQKKTTVRDEWEETGGPVYLINFRRMVGIEPMPGALCRMSATSQVGQSTPGEKAGPLLGWGQEEWKEKSI